MYKWAQMTAIELKKRFESIAADAQVEIDDMTGDGQHFGAMIVSTVFQGLPTIQRHRLVFGLVKAELDSGSLHAVQLKTYTPEQFKKLQTEG